MAVDLDIVGSAGVDVVPVAARFHQKLEAVVIPAAQRVGAEAGRVIGDRMSDEIARRVAASLPQAIQAGGQAAQRQASRQGSDAGGAFASSLRRKLTAAFQAMPKLDISLADTGVDAELARLRARMETLAGKRIGIDVDVAAAEAEVRRIDAELQRLGASHPNIAVRADTATARAALAELRAEIAAVDAADVNLDVDVDTTGARSSLMALGIQMAILMAIPLGPVIAAGLGSVVAMATAAGAGVGAFALAAVPAIKGVGEALTAQTAAQDDAASAAQRGSAATARAAQQAASQALQMAGAQASLATAHRNAERQIVASNRAIEDAERNLAQTGIRAAEQRRQAAENIERAERSLTDAKRDALRAEEALAQAHRDVSEELAKQREELEKQRKELSERLEDSSLDERDAVLRVTEAQEELKRVMKDPKATQLQRERALLAADEAEHALKRQREKIKELRAEILKQSKASAEGSDEVVSAQDRVVAAQERVADAQRKVADVAESVKDAQADAARVQEQIARDLADAQRRVADAVENSANVQIAAAEAIASAERGVASARLSGASATSTAITKAQEYERALAKLTPAQRDLFDSIAGPKGIKTAFKDWATALQPHVLPIFTRGVDGAKASLPGLTPLVTGAASAIQALMDKASAELKTPFWAGFKADLKESVEPAIVGFGVAFGNILKGMAGVVDAFLPHMDGIAKRSDSITERFAKWGTSLKGSPAFEKFLDYVKGSAPAVGALIGSIMTALLTTAQTLSPVSTMLMSVVTPLFDAISWLANNVPELVIALWGIWAVNKAVVVGMAAFGAAMLVYNSVILTAQIVTGGWAVALNATGIVPIIRAIVLVVGLLVAAVIYAYNNWDWFRITVDTVAKAIGKAASWLWENILKPAFDGIWWALKKAGDIAVWLWDVAIGPAFKAIWEAAKILFTIVVVGVLTPAYLAFKALGVIGGWLWKEVLKPVFKWIGDAAIWLWERAIKPAFSNFVRDLKAIGSAASWLWEKILRPVFGWIADKAAWVYDKGIKPAFNGIKTAIKSVADSFGVGRDSIRKAWDQIAGIAKKPVKFIVDHVYNAAIVPLWNRVADITGVDPLKKLELKGFARGGILPGQSTWRQGDDQLTPMRRGEGVYVSEAMRDPYERARLYAVNKAAMRGQSLANFQGGYAEGGIVGWLKDKASDVGDFFANPLDIFSKARKLVTDELKPLLTNPWARNVAKMPGKMLTGIKDKALGLLGFDSNGNIVGGGGSWVKPVDAPFGTPFGKAGPMWSSGRHTGLDFPAAIGTAIRAVAGGRVSAVQSGGPYGIHVTVNHGGGLSSLYAHMSQALTAAGAPVSAGQVIGRVGDTGNVTGPHLHLEARRNGASIDPMPFLTGGGGGGFTAPAAGAAQAYAKTMLRFYGWGPTQFGPLKKLWDGESNWNYRATNPTSGAYGIPQALPASKMASAGADWRTNPETQIRWGLQYIKDRPDYGTPAAAYAKWLGRSPHWYDDGGYLPPGLNLVANGTGKPEPVFTSSQWDTLRANAGRGGTTQLQADVHVYVGDREITDIVRTEIDIRDADTATALIYGRAS
ncbi:peptidoglycan DD-metalloendopeptidase family protein [Streptomyces sp. NPDC090301]|uniref:aggregation-promoting factor C-terminal-like domain-containing protein n=1 Tax=Streptomyces sp. NPDC090301 TaxID=3154975 RepID=UPI003440A475